MKRLLICVLAITICLTLVGCGTEKEEIDTSVERTTEQSEPVGE